MRWIVGVMMVVLAAGCVSKSKYAALESQIVEKDQLILKRDEQLERAKKEVERRQEFTNKLTEGFRELGKQLKPLRDQGLVTLEIVDGRPVVALKADILFESGSASLSEEGAGLVGKVADVLSKRTEEDFQVQGHTDNKPIKSKDYPSNWYLGSARAITVVEAMVTNGMPSDRLSAASFADTLPVGDNATEEGRALNRRIEIVLVPNLADFPGFEALMKEHRGRRGHDGKKRPKRPE